MRSLTGEEWIPFFVRVVPCPEYGNWTVTDTVYSPEAAGRPGKRRKRWLPELLSQELTRLGSYLPFWLGLIGS